MKYLLRLLAVFLLMGAVCSCSIRLDRTDCPCSLGMAVLPDSSDFSIGVWRKGGLFHSAVSDTLQKIGSRYYLSVEKGRYVVSAGRGEPCIPSGNQADSLYAWSTVSECDATGESLVLEAQLHKQFATLQIRLKNAPSASGRMYNLDLRGDVWGFDVAGMKPIGGGEFRCSVEGSAEDCLSVRIPRQMPKGGRLDMTLSYGSDVMFELELWSFLDSSGYDWSAADLKDIPLEIDCSETQGFIYIMPWENGFDIETIS